MNKHERHTLHEGSTMTALRIKTWLTAALVDVKRNQCIANWKEIGHELQVTCGYTSDNDAALQTGDNSFFGNAYGHQVWGVAYLYPGCNCSDVAQDIINDIEEQLAL